MSSDVSEIISHSPAQTRKLGADLGKRLQEGDLILLAGDLGAGKTCLTQGMAKGAGFEGVAASPSFMLVREYQGRLKMYHVDLYRLDNIEEINDLGIDDYLEGEGVCVVEWADKAMDWLPQSHLLIELAYGTAENDRRLRFEPQGQRYLDLTQELKETWNSR